jgi:transposase
MNQEEESTTDKNKSSKRLQAVLAIPGGEPVAQVCAKFSISRSSLYNYKGRALKAMIETLQDKKSRPHHPHNRLSEEKEKSIRMVCERHPTLSSYQIKEQLGADSTTPRTIQRVRERLHLPRFNKRDAPSIQAHRFTDGEKRLVRKTVESKLNLGPYRLAWDLQNLHGLNISPSTTKRIKRTINEWIFDELRSGLPEYVRYRNEVRGHYALRGKPSSTRLQEQDWFALPSVLDRLESFARYSLGSTSVELNGCIRLLGRNGDIPKLRYRQKV